MWKAATATIIIICENNCSGYITSFAKPSILRYLTGTEYATGTEYVRVLNIPGLHRILNMSQYTWIIVEYAWLCRNISEYAWIC